MFLKSRKGQFLPYADTAPRKGFPVLTISLIIINVAIFVWSLSNFEYVIVNYGFIPAYPTVITLFTSMFLHGGFDHILFNMWYLWIFGDNIESRLGKIKFLLLYFASGIFATFLQYITDPSSPIPSIGASGAISGILGSYLLLYRKEKILSSFGYTLIHVPAYVVIGFWFVIQLIFGTASLLGGMGSNIAFWAHIGGFIFGLLFTFLFVKRSKTISKSLKNPFHL